MSTSFTPSPPLAVIKGVSGNPAAVVTEIPPLNEDTSAPYISSASSSSSAIVVVIIIISSAVIVSASIYLLLRFLSRSFNHTFSVADDVVLRRHEDASSNQQTRNVDFGYLLDSLPIFTFRSVTPVNHAGGDCAVCLSRFEPRDRLRLLPLCCHAFHAACIDEWIVSNQTCPLCRSTVLPSTSDVLDKIISSTDNRGNAENGFRDGNGMGNGGSFRIEIGNISRRRVDGEAAAVEAVEGARRRSYSLGSFDYIVGDGGCEVPVGFTSHRRVVSGFNSTDKQSSVVILIPQPPGEVLAAASVSGGRNWLREYADRLASITISPRTMSFRSSGGRFFSGSSRRSQAVVAPVV